MPRAIISIVDPSGIIPFATYLASIGWDLIVEDETAQRLKTHGIHHRPLSILTGAQNPLQVRLNTLHPSIHAGISYQNSSADDALLLEYGYAPINLVVCNYPMVSPEHQQGDQHINVASDALLRAAAANYQHVVVLCDPEDYPRVQEQIDSFGAVSALLRLQLATKAFAYCRDHDTAIHAMVQHRLQMDATQPLPVALPDTLSLNLIKRFDLRYGSNPHQQAAYYTTSAPDEPLSSQHLGGQSPTVNTALNLDIAWHTASSFERPALVIVKHQTLIGVATAASAKLALSPALASNRSEAEGSVIAANRPINRAFVSELSSLYVNGIVAPAFTLNALDTLRQTRPNCTLIKANSEPGHRPRLLSTLHDGYILQTHDTDDPITFPWRNVTKWTASPDELRTLRFAWRCAQYAPSYAIVLASGEATIGIGSGQLTRLDAMKIAVGDAGAKCVGAVMASDTIITETDLISLASAAGITAIVQPGGALQDASLIAAADDAGIALLFTRTRHYR